MKKKEIQKLKERERGWRDERERDWGSLVILQEDKGQKCVGSVGG